MWFEHLEHSNDTVGFGGAVWYGGTIGWDDTLAYDGTLRCDDILGSDYILGCDDTLEEVSWIGYATQWHFKDVPYIGCATKCEGTIQCYTNVFSWHLDDVLWIRGAIEC